MSETYRSLAQCPALVLNADYRPLSYFPLSLWSWQDAIRAIVRDHVTVLSEYNEIVRSPSQEFRLPSVLVLKQYVPERRTPAFSRMNVFLRDRWECQYCGDRFATSELTFDHVIPRSRGGHTSWDNIVTSCYECNLQKGDRMTHECGMIPMNMPVQPSMPVLQRRAQEFPPAFRHESWRDYVYWNTDLVDQDD